MKEVTTVGVDLAKPVFTVHGQRVGIMMAPFVAAYRRNSKNDGNDAEAICEAVARPNMRFVPVKRAEQQAILSLHRVRQGFVEQRTATINRTRGLLAEFEVVLPPRTEQVRRAVGAMAEELPVLARQAIADLRAHLTYLDVRVDQYERQLVEWEGSPVALGAGGAGTTRSCRTLCQ